MKRILVKSSAGPYSILSGAAVIRRAHREIAGLGRFSSLHVVSSPKVWRAVGKSVQRGLRLSKSSSIHLFDDAEAAKNLRSMEQITRSLCRAGADRKSLVVAVGGGVIGDVAGFAAASFLRGLKLVPSQRRSFPRLTVPSAARQESIFRKGKTLSEPFTRRRWYSPIRSCCARSPIVNSAAALAEVIKHAVIADAEMFSMLEKDMERCCGGIGQRLVF